jgi:DNA-binding NarL/FixJ family response regulator
MTDVLRIVNTYTDDNYNTKGRAFTSTHAVRFAEGRAMITILLVDDKPAVLNGLRLRLGLEPDLEIVGEAQEGRGAVEMAKTLRPDVVIMDIGMPGMDGIAATERLVEVMPDTAVVVLSIHDDADTKTRALQAGAAAFVEKRLLTERLLTVIRSVTRRSPKCLGQVQDLTNCKE